MMRNQCCRRSDRRSTGKQGAGIGLLEGFAQNLLVFVRADIASVLPRQKLARIAQPGQPGLKAEVKRRHCCSSSWSSPLPRNDSSQGPGRWRGILSALGGLSGLHILPVGLVASKMSFNLFIKRSNPAAQSLSVALTLLHVLVEELLGTWVRFLLRH